MAKIEEIYGISPFSKDSSMDGAVLWGAFSNALQAQTANVLRPVLAAKGVEVYSKD